jgi:hypothetical protein
LLYHKVPQILPELGYDEKLSLGEAFRIMHGKISPTSFTTQLKEQAEKETSN